MAIVYFAHITDETITDESKLCLSRSIEIARRSEKDCDRCIVEVTQAVKLRRARFVRLGYS